MLRLFDRKERRRCMECEFWRPTTEIMGVCIHPDKRNVTKLGDQGCRNFQKFKSGK